MGSNTQVEQDNFKLTVKQSAISINEMQNELDLAIKDKQTQAIELFKATKLQSTMVFGLDDKQIAGIKLTSDMVMCFSSSITLNAARK